MEFTSKRSSIIWNFRLGVRDRRPAARNQDGSPIERVTGANALHTDMRSNEIKTGDEIQVQCLHARDDSRSVFLKTVIMTHGRVIQLSAGNAND